MRHHFIENVGGLIQKSFAAEDSDNNGVDVFVRLAPNLALHILEEAERALPIAALSELLEHMGEIGERELVLERVEAARDAAARREAGELVD